MDSGSYSERLAIDSAKGAAVYTSRVLPLYDFLVHGLSNPLAWRCSTRELQQLFDRNVSGVHLDVGVGSGYFLDHGTFPVPEPEITLLDLSESALEFTRNRIRRYRVTLQQGNVLERIHLGARTFQSIAMMYLLHCVPGTIAAKAVAFDHVGRYLAEDGVLFGATILGRNVPRGIVTDALLASYNARGIFSNRDDTLADLEEALAQRFEQSKVWMRGCVAMFEAKRYRSRGSSQC